MTSAMPNSSRWLFLIMFAFGGMTADQTQAQCVGDCDGGGHVTIDELILGVNIALNSQLLSACPAFDADNDGMVAINELILGVNNALTACNTIPVATPTATRTPGTPSPTVVAPLAIVGITSRTTIAMLQIPRAIGAVAAAAKAYALGGAPPAPATVPCPVAGNVRATSSSSLAFSGCSIPTTTGRVTINGTSNLLPTFISIDVDMDFRDATDAVVLSVGVNVGGDGTPTLGGPCLLTGVTFLARGSVGMRDAAERSSTLGFFRTNMAITVTQFDQNCTPERFQIVTDGMSNLFYGSTEIAVQAVGLSLDADTTVDPAIVSLGGGFDSPCLGGYVQVQSPLALAIATNSLCPGDGEVDAGTPRFVYKAGGVVDFDADGNGIPDVTDVPHCFDLQLVMCQ
jgi:hypothetical protein